MYDIENKGTVINKSITTKLVILDNRFNETFAYIVTVE